MQPKNKILGHHLIFEGAELVGKSWLMSQIYDYLEFKYNKNRVILDGCHWFNSDVGIFGMPHGKKCAQKYMEMLEILKKENVLFEKFHISDIVYNRLHRKKEIPYAVMEKKLKQLSTKIVFCVINEDEKLINKRIKDRLNLYPHYERILQNPSWYINQQREYKKEIAKTSLDVLQVNLSELPNKKEVNKILKWIGEL